MVFLSAFQDFVGRTMAGFPGPLSKLAYIGELRRNGDYEHWGLSRAHGDPAAKAAMSNAHTQIWLEVLRTPFPALFGELQSLSNGDAAVNAIANWREEQDRLTPPDSGGGSKRHFNSILLTLSQLAQAAKENSQRAA